MADHLDAPGLMSPGGDAKTDITDIYIFQKPGDASKSVLILNVNPLAPTLANEFNDDAAYDMLIDTDGDARADIGYRITFSKKHDGKQFAKVERTERKHGEALDTEEKLHSHHGEAHKMIIEHAPVSFGSDVVVTDGHGEGAGFRFYAGLRSDPFFFDLAAFLNGLQFHDPGTDFFLMKNVFGIVLEMPNVRGLGARPHVGYWARTLIPTGKGDRLGQDDQMGRPAINTVFNHGAEKNVFNATPPNMQRTAGNGSGVTFLKSFEDTLTSFGYSTANATAIADILLPDVLTYDYSNSGGFLNGRKLQDDVIDIELNLVTNGHKTTDNVGPHSDYSSVFPYLGMPHP